MILLQNISVPLDTDFSNLKPLVAAVLGCPESAVEHAELYRRSVDARRKSAVHFCCSFAVSAKGEAAFIRRRKAVAFTPYHYELPAPAATFEHRPVVVGFGPAGMFAALSLARQGLRPIVLERGRDADRRAADVQAFFAGGALDPESNVQFGEGGAGTFSDGKLNSGIHDPRCRSVLYDFVRFGADKRILYESKPHIGTDVLINIVKNIRKAILDLGGEVRFQSRLDGLLTENGALCGALVGEEVIPCDRLVLATGHSARDTLQMLQKTGVPLVRKPFAMGVRIEHSQAWLDRAMYGDFAGHKALPPADYKLAVHLENGRGVYSFCMCPGGQVINASSAVGAVAVNGMSNSRRDGENCNSAILTEVHPQDLPGDDVLAGCALQEKIERAAYRIGQGAVPVCTVGEFLKTDRPATLSVKPTVLPATVSADFDTIFPKFITDSLRAGLPLFDRKIAGFADSGAVLSAPETRSSCPVRVVRDASGQSTAIRGLYPCGEGAGYAGGILSAAVDGIRAAEHILSGE